MANKYGEPRPVVKSPDYTMPPVAQDTGAADQPDQHHRAALGRAIEIRPVGKNARKITHHALARLQQPEDIDPALFTNVERPGDGLFMGGRSARTATRCAPTRAA